MERGTKKMPRVERIITSDSIDINARYNDRMTALINACETLNAHAVEKLLLCENIDVNMEDKNGNTAFAIACIRGRVDIVEVLLKAPRIDANRQNLKGQTGFMIACRYNCEKIVKLLLKYEFVDFTLIDDNGNNAFMLACYGNHCKIMSLLLDLDCYDVNTQNNKGKTALMLIDTSDSMYEIVKMLLKRPDVDVNIKDHKGCTMFTKWFRNWLPPIGYIELMLERNDVEHDGKSYFDDNIFYNELFAPFKLILMIKNTKIPLNWDNGSVLHSLLDYPSLVQKSKMKIVKAILDRPDFDINTKRDNKSAFSRACCHVPSVAMLMLERKDLVVHTGETPSPLYECAKRKQTKLLEAIIERKKVNFSKYPKILKQLCERSNHYYSVDLDIVRILLTNGAVPTEPCFKRLPERKVFENWPSYLPEWTRFSAWRYPEIFNCKACAWLLCCKRVKPKLSKDMQYMILEYTARNWRKTKYKYKSVMVEIKD